MANVTTVQILQDGARNVTYHLVGVLDTSNQSVADFTTISGLSPVPTELRIDQVTYSISSQLGVQISWRATADVVALAVAGQGEVCFDEFGGLRNNSGAGKTGNVRIATTGWTSGTQSYDVLVHFTKMGV